MKKTIIFSILFIGLFIVFNSAQAKTMTMDIPLEIKQENASPLFLLNNFAQQIKKLLFLPVFAKTTSKDIELSCDKLADGSDVNLEKYFEFITYDEEVCYAQEGQPADLRLTCNVDSCFYEEEYPYICSNSAKWKIIDATVVTTSMDDSGNGGMGCGENHFDDFDQCMMAIFLQKSLLNPLVVASSTNWIQCAANWSTGNSFSITQPVGFINMDDIPSGAGYVGFHVQAGGGSLFGDEVYWKGIIQAVGQRPSLDSFTLTAIKYGETTPSTIGPGQSMTVCRGANLGISWSTSDSTSNVFYAGATEGNVGGEALVVGQSGSINRIAYYSTNFIFAVNGYAGEDYVQTFRSDEITITAVDCSASFSVDLSANPSSGTVPLNDVDLTADVSSTITGNTVYKFDCTNNGTWEHISAETTVDYYSVTDLCDYSAAGTYTAKVEATRGGLTATDTVNIVVSDSTNTPPNVPVLQSPLNSADPMNSAWINTDPTFQALVTDPDGDKVKAYFSVLGYGSSLGSLVNSGQVSSWGPINLGACFQNYWRAYAIDEHDLGSAWSGYWLVQMDKGVPTAAISYAATSEQSAFPVTLTESDACSGILTGDVDVRSKLVSSPAWSSYQDYLSTINDFTYTGLDNYQYQFRYRTQDNAGNWSAFTEGGVITVDINNPPIATDLSFVVSSLCTQPAPYYTFRWTYSDPDIDDQSAYILQIDNSFDFSSPQVNLNITGLSDLSPSSDSQSIIVATSPGPNQIGFNTTYYWRVKVYDEHALASKNWINGVPFSFTTPIHHYPSCDFSWNPNQPNAGETVSFIDTSRCWDEDPINGANCSINSGDAFLWTFTGGEPPASSSENPSATFANPGNHDVTLQVTDSDGHTCSTTKSIRVNYPVPKWKEILPW